MIVTFVNVVLLVAVVEVWGMESELIDSPSSHGRGKKPNVSPSVSGEDKDKRRTIVRTAGRQSSS
jgi:hypothetical protein